MNQVNKSTSQSLSVLFVCLDNTCRSPMAEAVMKYILKNVGFHDFLVDSAGTKGYHVGKNTDAITLQILKEKGIENFTHQARQICIEDFYKFDWILCMDQGNLWDLQSMKPANSAAKLQRLGEFVDNMDVEDVYDPYGDTNLEAFYCVYNHIFHTCNVFVKQVLGRRNRSSYPRNKRVKIRQNTN
ncbi:low molecular weight phosphotyrosine protein phosphatase 1 isoform X1 [Folsomia candida]|nr:low molecular weight phosphotyrosine protein phosphatase 1 isoform X1 [Folsomia candida]